MVMKTTPLTAEERMQRYGYRQIPEVQADGKTEYRRVALTLEDLLHPQMGDVAVLSSVNNLETNYLASVFRTVWPMIPMRSFCTTAVFIGRCQCSDITAPTSP